jgi:transposase
MVSKPKRVEELERMLAMSEVNSIKFMRNKKGLSISSLAKVFDINWRTAKKYADEEQLPQETPPVQRGMMYREKWGEMVSDWLFEDSKLKRKQRRTSKALFLQLKEYGFKGSYRTVCNYIAEWHSKNPCAEEGTTYERLEHPAGEAQLDFGKMEVVHNDQYVDINALIMSYPHSNAAFVVPLLAENTECFLHGLQQLFIQSGGVPNQIRIDNLPAAVAKVQRGQTPIFTDSFLRFQNYFGFGIQACNPYSGHEKGHVENKVKYVRCNFFAVPPVIRNIEELDEKLQVLLAEDRKRPHYQRGTLIETLWLKEKKHLSALPLERYPVFEYETFRVNKYGEIKIDHETYWVPQGSQHRLVQVRKEWNRFVVYSPQGERLYEAPRPYMGKGRPIPWKDIFREWKIKPRAVLYSRHFKHLPMRLQKYLQVDSLDERKNRLIRIQSLLPVHSIKELAERFYEVVEPKTLDSPTYDVDWKAYDALAPKKEANANE